MVYLMTQEVLWKQELQRTLEDMVQIGFET